MAIKTTPASTADTDEDRWEAGVTSGKYRYGSKAAGGYVDNATGQWYSGARNRRPTLNRAKKWNELIAGGTFRKGGGGGYVDVATRKWYAPDSPIPGMKDEETETEGEE